MLPGRPAFVSLGGNLCIDRGHPRLIVGHPRPDIVRSDDAGHRRDGNAPRLIFGYGEICN
jgi:hypothetical protein